MKTYPILLASTLACALPTACQTFDPTEAVLDNQYPSSDAGPDDSITVYKGWWSVAEFAEPVPAGTESDPVRVVNNTDFAYALLAPGWDPESGTSPAKLVPVRTTNKLSVARGDTLHIVISDTTTRGSCAAAEPLAQDDADFITQRIFVAEFSGVTYDAATCTTSPISDGGFGGGGG
jgi:hypothetical protein